MNKPKTNGWRFAGAAGLSMALALGGCATSGKVEEPAKAATSDALRDAKSTVASDKNLSDAAKAIGFEIAPKAELLMPKQRGRTGGRRFDLKTDDAEAGSVYQAIAESAGLNAAVAPDIAKERVSVAMRDVSVKEAMETMLQLYGHEYTIDSKRLVVGKPTLTSRLFKVSYLVGQRKGQSDLRISSGSVSDSQGPQGTSTTGSTTGQQNTGTSGSASGGAGQQMQASRVSTTEQNDFWGVLEGTLKSIAGGDGRLVLVNPQAGTVFVKAMPSQLRDVESYVKALELSVGRQVMLEAKIVEVTLTNDSQSGINWGAFKSGPNSKSAIGFMPQGSTIGNSSMPGNLSSTIVPGADGSVGADGMMSFAPGISLAAGGLLKGGILGLAFQTSNFAALLSFLQTQGSVHVLSSPRIATLNNQKALLKVGTDEFFVTNVSASTTVAAGGGTTSTPSVSVAPFFSGIALDVTPEVGEDGQIILHVHPQVSNVTEKTKNVSLGALGSLTLPLASSTINETDSVVKLTDGNIVAIGGLMRQYGFSEVSKVPGGGEMLGSGRGTGQKSELVILIKPTIIKTEGDWASGLDGFGGTKQ